MRGARRWLVLTIAGHVVPVYLCKPGHPYLHSTENHENVGCFDLEAPRIAISVAQSDAAIRETFVHELLHAVCHFSGVDHNFLGNSFKKEEMFVRQFSPFLFASLTSAKLLRLPKIRRYLEAA